MRYSENDFATYRVAFEGRHGLSSASTGEDFCNAILREITAGTVLTELLLISGGD